MELSYPPTHQAQSADACYPPTHQARTAMDKLDELFRLQYDLPSDWFDISIPRLNSHRNHLPTEDQVKISKMRRRIRNRWYAKASRGRKAKSTMAASMPKMPRGRQPKAVRERLPRQGKVDIEGCTVYNPPVKDQIPELRPAKGIMVKYKVCPAKRFMAEPGEAGITTAASPPVHVNTTHLFTLGTSRQPAEPLPTTKRAGQ